MFSESLVTQVTAGLNKRKAAEEKQREESAHRRKELKMPMYETDYFKKANAAAVRKLLDAGLAKTYEQKKVSLLDQAKENIQAKHTEHDFNVLIGREYQKVREATENGISYLRKHISERPEGFNN